MQLTRGERAFAIFNYIFLLILATVFVLPLLSVLASSLVGQEEWARRGAHILVPEQVDLTSYRLLLRPGSLFFSGFMISVARVVVGTSLNLAFTTTLAYVLSKRQIPGRAAITLFVFITMVFNGGLIPQYILVDSLRLTDTFWAMILPVLVNPWFMFIMRNFFMGIPESLEEAAIMDGAQPAQRLLRIILPLSLPSIATIGMFYAVFHWNEWFQAFIYINDARSLPLQVVLRQILVSAMVEDTDIVSIDRMPPTETIRSTMIVLTVTPILCVYPFIQKYFVKGALIGSVKG